MMLLIDILCNYISSFTFYGLPKKSPNKKTSLKVFYSL